MTKESYLELCRVMDQEPDPAQFPVEFNDFPYYVQELFTIVNMLPDVWDGMSGAYMGKNFSILPYLFGVYDIEDEKLAVQIINIIIAETARVYNKKLESKAKKAKQMGKSK